MWDPTPWFVDGAEHSADVARTLAFAATKGAEGIILPGDLKVQPLNVPGQGVRVAPGGALILNRYPGGGSQTYIGRNPIEHVVDVTPTGSAGGRSDLVVATVEDPQFDGPEPPDPTNHQYIHTRTIRGVPAGTTSARQLNLGYPAIALARIDLPASTGTVTAAMITDLRRVALPRSLRMTHTFDITTTDTLNATTNKWWPAEAVWNVDVPEWAAIHKIRADVTNIVNLDANFEGFLEVVISTTTQATARLDVVWAGATGRHNFVVSGQTPVGAVHRGNTVPVRLRGRRSAGNGRLNATNLSQVIYDIEFTEGAI